MVKEITLKILGSMLIIFTFALLLMIFFDVLNDDYDLYKVIISISIIALLIALVIVTLLIMTEVE